MATGRRTVALVEEGAGLAGDNVVWDLPTGVVGVRYCDSQTVFRFQAETQIIERRYFSPLICFLGVRKKKRKRKTETKNRIKLNSSIIYKNNIILFKLFSTI